MADTPSVTALHVVPARGGPQRALDAVEVTDAGLVGDHHLGGRRPVTVVAQGELDAAAAELGAPVACGSTYRNVTVSLDALPRDAGGRLHLGAVVLELQGDCAPCGFMERSVGPGAKAALVQRAGIWATVLVPGTVRVGDPVRVE
ncbi:MAG: MOSC domain-containing protein [Planctomycetes bacterium]|nr:MOSC domain-containing protein [Planctomycetota bacterium]